MALIDSYSLQHLLLFLVKKPLIHRERVEKMEALENAVPSDDPFEQV